MKDFIYLVQGKAELMKNYLHLSENPNADVIFLTYDQPIETVINQAIEESIFFPKSTWAEGRNKLLEMALNKGEYLYYIFCDDDIKFIKGSWETFEKQLLQYKPAIAVPINRKTFQTPLKGMKSQCFLTNDEQLMAFHQDVVKDFILLPYQNQFDSIYWWISCEIQEVLIQNFYCSDIIQFNNIFISNDSGENYVRPESESDHKMLYQLVDDWLSDQFLSKYKHMPYPKRIFILVRTFSYYFHRLIATPKYSVSVNKLKELLSTDSELYKQTINLREKFTHLK
ncbi:hypothetical protein H6F39_09940 [Anabaena sp. FACHB-1250]|uniref:Uncharacterized protein n=1 Tax=Dolichospermum flos-aquae LEGE 04289 TaxID=1828708 RepID=A0ACC5Q0X3_DOLFA|nr:MULTISPECIES: hypothetical protein [Nostocales]MBD2141673.1 hypothetical protein [Anabaena sp. FACHB-1250]MBD2267615.1 hypothetical protein [Anabaena sp. FACHB-1391]MBE9218287.1 hypothetical protein [Dolichospermum flos-aquae LEGE 04289]